VGDADDGVQGQDIRYDRKKWLSSVRTEILSANSDVNGFILDMKSMSQTEAVQNRLVAFHKEAGIIYGNMQHEFGLPAVHAENPERASAERRSLDTEVDQLSVHDVESAGNCTRVGAAREADCDEGSASMPLLMHHRDIRPT
jgi:hypothetical protein